MYEVVTRSTKGIGESIAKKLFENGFFVIVNYANDDNSAEGFKEK